MDILKHVLLTAFAIAAPAISAQNDLKSVASDINLIVANDTGRNGYYDQKPIADLMGEVAAQTGPEAVLALGDIHHYQGVQSVDDPLWMTNFELIYSHPELQVEWYPVLGNHEYRGNSQAVIDYSSKSRRWEMPARYYTRTFDEGDASLRVIFLDTAPLIDKYHKKSDTYPDVAGQDADRQLQWLERTLADATEDWVVVVGHHPIYADTDKTDSERTDMQKRVDSILRRHKVDMYICGHIHNFQHLRMPGSDIDYVVNSSGSLARQPHATEGTVFCSGDPGISLLCASGQALRLHMIDRDGKIIHTVSRTR